jgi:hypothetical protein
VGEFGHYEDMPGRIVLSLLERFSKSERCLPVPVEIEGVGERWHYTIVAGYGRTKWRIEEPQMLLKWEGGQREFDERCAVFGSIFW